MGKTSYRTSWEEGRPWLRPVHGNPSKASCIYCKKDFFVDKCGASQVKSHSQSRVHLNNEHCHKKQNFLMQVIPAGQPTSPLSLSDEEMVLKAVTLQVLHDMEFNISFSSASSQPALLTEMFPDSTIAKTFSCGASKMAYARML